MNKIVLYYNTAINLVFAVSNVQPLIITSLLRENII